MSALANADLWEAIHEYVRACGGNPDERIMGNVPRMNAVTRVETALTKRVFDSTGEPTDLTHKWFYAPDEDAETFHGGPFKTKEEAIAAGRNEYDHDFAVFEGEPVDPSDYIAGVTDFDWLMERLEEAIGDDCGNEHDVVEFRNDPKEASAELGKLMVRWAQKHLTCRWHRGVGSERVAHEEQCDR